MIFRRPILSAALLLVAASATAAPIPFGDVETVRVYPRLNFRSAVQIEEIPDGSGRLVLLSQIGIAHVFPNIPDPDPSQVQSFLNLTAQTRVSFEEGLLGIAFDPDYATNGEFYVYYSHNSTNPSTSRLSRFTNATPSGNSVSVATEEVLLAVLQDFSNHNGGTIAFGPDNMLYLGLGDGGSGNDPNNRAQDTTNFLGSILRLDVRGTPDQGLPYRIPTDNPFFVSGPAGTQTKKEIYAYGVRNPYRFSFDREQGFLMAGDVGQGTWEEVNRIPAGGNMGWRTCEGAYVRGSTTTACNLAGSILPLIAYRTRSTDSRGVQRQAVVGGQTYYGASIPALQGMYVYGDYATGEVWALRYNGTSVSDAGLLAELKLPLAAFGILESGEMLILHYNSSSTPSGGIYALTPSTPSHADQWHAY